MRFLFVAVLTLLLLSSCGPAEGEKVKDYMILGVGARTCNAWTEARAEGPQSPEAKLLLTWVLGFLSGYNLYGDGGGNVTEGIGASEVAPWIDKYCKEHPGAKVADAANEFEVARRSP